MPRKRPYHHGNLRQSLLDAAVGLIAEAGPMAFGMREVARRAGVSHNAPYRHFRDRDELLAAVATEGFRELTKAMLDAAKSRATGLERLKSSGLAYVLFALRRPQHFAAMFDAPFSNTRYPECKKAGEQAFLTLVSFVEMSQREGGLPEGDTSRQALLAWSLVHGIAKLAITRRFPFRSKAAVASFAEFAIERSLLALSRPDKS